MRNVRKCGEFKGSASRQSEEARERIMEDIINTASSDVDPDLIDGLSRVMIRPENQTLNQEHNQLRAINRSSFQHHDNFKRTNGLVQEYQGENSMISVGMRSQGSDAYTCWAYSCASMLRTSMKLLIRRCHEIGVIDQWKMNKLLRYISKERIHVELRNLIMMILLPKKLHVDDDSQAAFLRAAVSRIANPTVMEPRGLDFLRPIFELMQANYYIGLAPDQVHVYYKKYINDYKPQTTLQPGELSIRDAVKNQLTPVGSVDFNGSAHAMVLDTINEDDEFVFKNTHTDNKQVTVPANGQRAPDEFYFIHIEPL